uniref:hypothetical protein n=1 Tax=Petrocella atlantisensis TaxID=2173034 RepID=UPI002ED48288
MKKYRYKSYEALTGNKSVEEKIATVVGTLNLFINKRGLPKLDNNLTFLFFFLAIKIFDILFGPLYGISTI